MTNAKIFELLNPMRSSHRSAYDSCTKILANVDCVLVDMIIRDCDSSILLLYSLHNGEPPTHEICISLNSGWVAVWRLADKTVLLDRGLADDAIDIMNHIITDKPHLRSYSCDTSIFSSEHSDQQNDVKRNFSKRYKMAVTYTCEIDADFATATCIAKQISEQLPKSLPRDLNFSSVELSVVK